LLYASPGNCHTQPLSFSRTINLCFEKENYMAPVARRPLHLGFIGAGATSSKNIAALLGDLIEANGGKAKVILPATKQHWTEGIEAVADYALENSIPVALITDDTTQEVKTLKPYISQASEKVKAQAVAVKIVDTTANGSGRLLILWDDEDDDCYTALERAEKQGVEAFDLTAGLHKLEFTGGGEDAQAAPDDDEPETDDLDEASEEDLQEMADALDINVEEVDTWDEVRDLIRQARADAEEGDDAEMEGGDLPSADEVLEWDFPTLKDYAQTNGIEVPPRSKTFGYRNAIVAWVEAAAGHAAAQEREEGDLELPDDDGELPMQIGEFDFSEHLDPLKEQIDGLRHDISSLGTLIATMDKAFTENLIEVRTAIMEVTPTGTIQKAQQAATKTVAKKAAPAAKAASTTKAVQRPVKAPQKAAPAKAPARPVKKAAPTQEPDGRPLDPFMHLLGKKLTRAQAREIMIANQNKGRGRPTEDERRLVAQAKAIVPQV